MVLAGTDDVGHKASSESRCILSTLLSGQASSSQTHRHLLPDPFYQPHYHPTRESYSCFLRDSEGRYSGAQVHLALPNDKGLPIYVSIPHLGVHGLAFCNGDGHHHRQTSQSAAQVEESPVEQDDGQGTDGDGHQGQAGGADEGGGGAVTTLARMLHTMWSTLMF